MEAVKGSLVQAVILAGGLGSRISEETYLRPKPMVTIGNRPMLWHIFRRLSSHGINDFIVCLGYKGEVIKDYFLNFNYYNSNIKVATKTAEVKIFHESQEDWNVSLIETGELSGTGERLKRVEAYLNSQEFFFTYGDGLTDQNLNDTLRFHRSKGKLVTMTVVKPPARYGAVEYNLGLVSNFTEKHVSHNAFVNGGFFVLNPEIFANLQEYTNPSWEIDILPNLVKRQELSAYEHNGFWFAMDTLRDKEFLEEIWRGGSAPWLSKPK